MRKLIFILSIFHWSFAQAQSQLTIEKCYELARQNYPLIKQESLIEKAREFSIANVRSGQLPQFTINGQATYQSAVTEVPIRTPTFEFEPLSKDQYRIYGELNQSIYNGGLNAEQRQMAESNSLLEKQQLEVELYKIRERIDHLFFGILLVDEQTAQIELLKKDLQTNISKTESALKNGTAFKMSLDLLQAEYLNAEQRIIETQSIRQAYMIMLGYFIHQPLDEFTKLEKPIVLSFSEEAIITRPELTLFNYQNEILGAQYELSKTNIKPHFNFFLQGGYGRPGLNMLLNEFETYYQGGIRFSWSLSGFYNANRDKQLLDINMQKVNTQKEAFVFNTNLVSSQQKQELEKLQKLIAVDDKIIDLRTRIKQTAEVQQENGVITTNDFLKELNAEDMAKQNRLLHEMQLLMALYAYQNTIGTNN